MCSAGDCSAQAHIPIVSPDGRHFEWRADSYASSNEEIPIDLSTVAIVSGLLLTYALISGRVEGTVLTAPLLFALFGFLAGAGGIGLVGFDVEHSAVHVIAEATLVLVLFTDAARIDLDRVRSDHNLPVRMLLLGLPFAILFGGFVAAWLFPAFLSMGSRITGSAPRAD